MDMTNVIQSSGDSAEVITGMQTSRRVSTAMNITLAAHRSTVNTTRHSTTAMEITMKTVSSSSSSVTSLPTNNSAAAGILHILKLCLDLVLMLSNLLSAVYSRHIYMWSKSIMLLWLMAATHNNIIFFRV